MATTILVTLLVVRNVLTGQRVTEQSDEVEVSEGSGFAESQPVASRSFMNELRPCWDGEVETTANDTKAVISDNHLYFDLMSSNEAIYEASMARFRAWVKEDFYAASEWVVTLPINSASDHLYRIVLNHYIESDPANALIWLEDADDDSLWNEYGPGLARIHATHDPMATLVWVEQITNEAAYRTAVNAVVEQWTYHNPEQAVSYALSIEHPVVKSDLLITIVYAMVSVDPHWLINVIEHIDDPLIYRRVAQAYYNAIDS